MAVGVRLRRVTMRSLRWFGRTRPDLPEGCQEQLSPDFLRFIWRTRRTGRDAHARLFEGAGPDKAAHRLRTPTQVRTYVDALRRATAGGNVGVPHR